MNKNEKSTKVLLTAFSDTLIGGTDMPNLKSLQENSHFFQDLSIGINDYFILYAFKHIIQKKSCKGGICLLSCEDNIGIHDYQKDKNYLQKVFMITKNDRRHVIKISIEENGTFKALQDNDFINSLIWAVDPAQDYKEGAEFDQLKDSIHFVYTGDNDSETDEIVILSIQTF